MFMARVTGEAGHLPAAEAQYGLPLWPVVAGALLAEVRSGATQQQAHGFFHSVGRRIAAMTSVDDIEDLEGLASRANLLWAKLGWGSVTMTMGEGGIDLRHTGVPPMPSIGDDGQWLAAAGSILEGTYDSWFRSLGSTAHFQTRLTRQAEDGFDFRHAA